MNNEILTISPSGMVHTYCIKGEKLILIDAGNPGDGEKILKELSSKGIDPKDISLIIITHCHMDHFGGLSVLKEKTGAPVAIHKSGADFLKRSENSPVIPWGPLGHIMKLLINIMRPKTSLPGITADILIDDELDLSPYGVKGKAVSTPGHTDDSISVILDKSAIIGDLLMDFRKTGIPNYPIFAVDKTQVKKSVKYIMDLGMDTIHPAHGGPFTKEAMMKKFEKDLQEV